MDKLTKEWIEEIRTKKKKICAMIPARYNSSRLNGKPLLKIDGITIIARTYLQTKKSKYIDKVYVVTDDVRIKNEIIEVSGDKDSVIMVTDECENGTERICKALEKEHIDDNYKLIVNVQGDEPFIDPEMIDYMIEKYIQDGYTNLDVVCATLHDVIKNKEYLNKTSFGKMVIDTHNHVIYCSRTLIPSNKKSQIVDDYQYLTHIGIFIFQRWFLQKYMKHPNTPLQLMEDIEWLKIIEMGYKIKSFLVTTECEIGVNTIEDYEYLKNKYEKHN